MSLFQNVKSDDSIAKERDSVGGSRVLDSDLYKGTVTLAYGVKAASEAIGLAVVIKTESGGEIRETLWTTSGKAKGGKNYYEDKQGKKQYLPGYLAANGLCLLTVGKELSEMATEEKVIPLYSSEAKAEVPTKVPMLVDLLGKEILVGVIRQTVDKTVKDAAGNYVPTGETRDENTIDKFFRARDRMTVAEILAQATEASFADTWVEKFKGKTIDKAKAAGQAGTAGAPRAAAQPAAAAGRPAQSLFA